MKGASFILFLTFAHNQSALKQHNAGHNPRALFSDDKRQSDARRDHALVGQ